jgi:hypothetical protein
LNDFQLICELPKPKFKLKYPKNWITLTQTQCSINTQKFRPLHIDFFFIWIRIYWPWAIQTKYIYSDSAPWDLQKGTEKVRKCVKLNLIALYLTNTPNSLNFIIILHLFFDFRKKLSISEKIKKYSFLKLKQTIWKILFF